MINIRKNIGLTFDDVLLVPKKTNLVSRSEVDLSTNLTKKIKLKIPVISANMDTVTETAMAIALGRQGGIGIIHRFLTVEKEAEMVSIVKKEKEYIARDLTGKIVHRLENRNELLGEVPGVLGVKTGWTENARENLVTYIERDGKKVIIALLGSQDRFGETGELIEWIYNSHSSP